MNNGNPYLGSKRRMARRKKIERAIARGEKLTRIAAANDVTEARVRQIAAAMRTN